MVTSSSGRCTAQSDCVELPPALPSGGTPSCRNCARRRETLESCCGAECAPLRPTERTSCGKAWTNTAAKSVTLIEPPPSSTDLPTVETTVVVAHCAAGKV